MFKFLGDLFVHPSLLATDFDALSRVEGEVLKILVDHPTLEVPVLEVVGMFDVQQMEGYHQILEHRRNLLTFPITPL